jgi:GNAT superfamily N-acetyltransferase
VRVRAATPADAEALASLSGQLGYPADVPTILRRLAQVERGVVLVALDAEGAVCAMAHADPRHLLITEPFVELEELVVDEAVRGAGAGAMLLAAVEAWRTSRASRACGCGPTCCASARIVFICARATSRRSARQFS